MPNEIQKLKEQLKTKEKEIIELKELLAEAEQEIKELNNFHGLKRPKPGILESASLNKFIKRTAFFLFCAVIILIGLYPWLFKNEVLNGNKETGNVAVEENNSANSEPQGEAKDTQGSAPENQTAPPAAEESAEPAKDIFKPQNMLVVASDLGWLNVRTEPNVENGQIIKKINSGEEYEWLEKTENNWYKIKIDKEGHTGYVSEEYVETK
ncbi:hypothetical protein COT99_03875 [Candidatus Falkowbacteria bacterium CG10_big_fil_rev_8_21_14_0_10_43_10]|uniref:SH3b domain-containing protein n=1 Tax=Candidatus Falkowbacteria bacterium CG10_big_fil_rev_8_21_14_0_10_43_10 TaxID=1974567 RepID=A0A2H0V1E2_9BACT|nr:MAG: hypothetical protein COT99_03875 [Candidatus Falkowbacteria bacterium CG10_big_fil_rev_8_21_14_0_10_43_10]